MFSNLSISTSLNDFCRELILLNGPKYTLYFSLVISFNLIF